MQMLQNLLVDNGFVVALLITGLILLVSSWISINLTNKKIPAAAIAIFTGLLLAYSGGAITNGKHGIADITVFSGFTLLGGSMLRDFTIVSTGMGARFSEIKKAGLPGVLSLIIGISLSFFGGAILAALMGYTDTKSITTIGAGACSFIVGPVTGTAIGASSGVIALSIGAGIAKSIIVTLGTAPLARLIGLDNPKAAMIFGGLAGTTSGVAAGLAATDPKLVPYGTVTATFYTGLGCLLCPSLFYFVVQWIITLFGE
jgi:malonate transporter MadM subunit